MKPQMCWKSLYCTDSVFHAFLNVIYFQTSLNLWWLNFIILFQKQTNINDPPFRIQTFNTKTWGGKNVQHFRLGTGCVKRASDVSPLLLQFSPRLFLVHVRGASPYCILLLIMHFLKVDYHWNTSMQYSIFLLFFLSKDKVREEKIQKVNMREILKYVTP